MTEIGYFLSSEEHPPQTLLTQAIAAEEAGFQSLLISDHFHPWNDRQGQSPFVWSVIGGGSAARTCLRVTTGVTCPTVRIHPAVIAQAAATSQLLCQGRFSLGVGSGEKLNEHVLGDRWPSAEVRLEMLEEAIEIIRGLWRGGNYSHHGKHYTVETARIYSLPEAPPPILISGFGPKSIRLAARLGDGFVTTKPDGEHVKLYRDTGGRGRAIAACKFCWGQDEERAIALAHDLWPTEGLSGELSQELPMPAHFDQAASIVTKEMIAESIPCGPDPQRYAASLRKYLSAGFDEVYVNQIGPDTKGFLQFFNAEVRPLLSLE